MALLLSSAKVITLMNFLYTYINQKGMYNNFYVFLLLKSLNLLELCKDGDMKYMSMSVPKNEVLDVVTIMACYKGSWKPVCDTNWSHEDASVLCKAAHYTPQGT